MPPAAGYGAPQYMQYPPMPQQYHPHAYPQPGYPPQQFHPHGQQSQPHPQVQQQHKPSATTPPQKIKDWTPDFTEKQKIDTWFDDLDEEMSGRIGGASAVNFLKSSHLPKDVLRVIWSLADSESKGSVNRQQFYNVIRLVSIALSPIYAGAVPTVDKYNDNIYQSFALPQFSTKSDSIQTATVASQVPQISGDAALDALVAETIPQINQAPELEFHPAANPSPGVGNQHHSNPAIHNIPPTGVSTGYPHPAVVPNQHYQTQFPGHMNHPHAIPPHNHQMYPPHMHYAHYPPPQHPQAPSNGPVADEDFTEFASASVASISESNQAHNLINRQASQPNLGNDLLFDFNIDNNVNGNSHVNNPQGGPQLLQSESINATSSIPTHSSKEVDIEDDDFTDFTGATVSDTTSHVNPLPNQPQPTLQMPSPSNHTATRDMISNIAHRISSSPRNNGNSVGKSQETQNNQMPIIDVPPSVSIPQAASHPTDDAILLGPVIPNEPINNKNRLSIFDDMVELDLSANNEDWDDFAEASASNTANTIQGANNTDAMIEKAPIVHDDLFISFDSIPPMPQASHDHGTIVKSSEVLTENVSMMYETSGASTDQSHLSDDMFSDFEGAKVTNQLDVSHSIDDAKQNNSHANDTVFPSPSIAANNMTSDHVNPGLISESQRTQSNGKVADLFDAFDFVEPTQTSPQPIATSIDLFGSMSSGPIQNNIANGNSTTIADAFYFVESSETLTQPATANIDLFESQGSMQIQTTSEGNTIDDDFEADFGDFQGTEASTHIESTAKTTSSNNIIDLFDGFGDHTTMTSSISATSHVGSTARGSTSNITDLFDMSAMEMPIASNNTWTNTSFDPFGESTMISNTTETKPSIALTVPSVIMPIRVSTVSKDLDNLSHTLLLHGHVKEAWLCYQQADMKENIDILNNDKRQAVDNDELEKALELKNQIAHLTKQLYNSTEEMRWKSLCEKNGVHIDTSYSLNEDIDTIRSYNATIAGKFQSHFSSILSSSTGLRDRIIHISQAKHSYHIILALYTSHMNHLAYWENILHYIKTQILLSKELLCSKSFGSSNYPNLSPQDQDTCKKNDKFIKYIDGLYVILYAGYSMLATCKQAFVLSDKISEVESLLDEMTSSLPSIHDSPLSKEVSAIKERVSKEQTIASFDQSSRFCNLTFQHLSKGAVACFPH